MEVAVYAALSGIWWMSSFTFLLPLLFLLKYSKFFQDRWFAFIFARILRPVVGPKITPIRKKVFDLLKENLPKRDDSNFLNILEIGIGSGANLDFYPENSRLIALDMNPDFETYFRENQKKYPHITHVKTIISFAENMKDVDDSSLDIVISTHVLCSVTSITDCMKEIKRVLKPGGKFLFLEHVAFPKSLWSSSVQKLTDPLWTIYFNGCHITRNIADNIRDAGFSDIICEQLQPKNLLLFFRPHIYGLATK